MSGELSSPWGDWIEAKKSALFTDSITGRCSQKRHNTTGKHNKDKSISVQWCVMEGVCLVYIIRSIFFVKLNELEDFLIYFGRILSWGADVTSKILKRFSASPINTVLFWITFYNLFSARMHNPLFPRFGSDLTFNVVVLFWFDLLQNNNKKLKMHLFLLFYLLINK